MNVYDVINCTGEVVMKVIDGTPAAPSESKTVYRCKGGDGCMKSDNERCEMTCNGDAPDNNPPYICPYNHWRSAKWEAVSITRRSPSPSDEFDKTMQELKKTLDNWTEVSPQPQQTAIDSAIDSVEL